MSGIPAVIWSIVLLVVLGATVLIGARSARHAGRLQSTGARYAAVAVILAIAVALWVGPAMFLASDGS